jgi:hypothetical protein
MSERTDAIVAVGTTENVPAPAPAQVRRLARHLGRSAFPGDRNDLVRFAERLHAPDDVIIDLRHLPGGQFRDVDEVAKALLAQAEREAGSTRTA